MQTSPHNQQPNAKQAGFTLLELLAVAGALALLSLTLAPVLAQNRPQVSSAQCMSNFRVLMNALQFYTEDNSGYLPPNPDDGNTVQGHAWCPGVAGPGDSGEYDSELLKDPTRSLLIDYLNGRTTVFSCVADPRHSKGATGKSAAGTNYLGQVIRPARSIAMNVALGTVCPGFSSSGSHSGKPNLPTNGSWLDNTHSHRANLPYRTFKKLSAVSHSPENLWTLIEEDSRSVNDSVFAFGMNQAEWLDFPAPNHDFGSVISFADGHSELRKWVDSRTRPGTSVVRLKVPGSLDWAWLAERTTSRAQ